MEYCKEMLGQEVHLVIYNRNYGTKKCKHCGQEIPNTELEWFYKEGFFSKIEFDGDNILYFAIWEDDDYKDHEVLINRRWIGDVIEWKKALWNEEPRELDVEFNKYAKNVSIFDLECSGIEDCIAGAFATKEEADKWLEEFSRGVNYD